MSDMYLGSQLPLYQNVRIRCINKDTGKTRIERYAKNRVTRLMLWGISKFLSGEFNDSTPDKIYEYIPRYLALGANRPTVGDTTTVTTTVTVNDTRLLSEYKMLTSNGVTEPVRRVSIQSRKHNQVATQFTDSFVKLSLSAYISSTQYDGLEIGEAGLFSKEKDNNCVARVVFSPFVKKEDEVIDIQWDITLLSYGTTKYPQSVNINGPSRVVIPLTYTPYQLVTVDLGLRYDFVTKNPAHNSCNFYTSNGDIIFRHYLSGYYNNQIRRVGTQDAIDNWDTYLRNLNENLKETIGIDLGINANYLCDILNGSSLKDSQIFYNDTEHDQLLPLQFRLGTAGRSPGMPTLLIDAGENLLLDSDDDQLATSDPVAGATLSQPLYMSFICKENKTYNKVDTGATIKFNTKMDGNYKITDTDGNTTRYKVTNNEIFKKQDSGTYETTNTYLHNNHIVYDTGIATGYVYDTDGKIYKEELEEFTRSVTNAYTAWDDKELSKLRIYKTDDNSEIIDTNYIINWESDKSVYENDSDTGYHVTNDGYFAIGQTHLLKPIINPVDSTDLSVTWSISNSNIAKINPGGVLTSWNVGETYAIVTTSNGLKNRVTVEVTKNTAFVAVDEVTVDPVYLSINAENDKNKQFIVTANITPVFASYTTVEWSGDNDLSRICTFKAQENNQVQITLNGSGNIGRGYITATTQDGKSASCLVTVSYSINPDEDCPDESHRDLTS